jgi:hypothetical protein
MVFIWLVHIVQLIVAFLAWALGAGRAKICNVYGSGCVGLYSITLADTD